MSGGLIETKNTQYITLCSVKTIIYVLVGILATVDGPLTIDTLCPMIGHLAILCGRTQANNARVDTLLVLTGLLGGTLAVTPTSNIGA